MADALSRPVDQSLDHALRPALALESRNRLGAHRRQDVVACGQADEEGEGHEPDAQAEEGSYLGEAGDVGGVVVGGAGVGSGLKVGEVAEPDVVIDDNEHCAVLVAVRPKVDKGRTYSMKR